MLNLFFLNIKCVLNTALDDSGESSEGVVNLKIAKPARVSVEPYGTLHSTQGNQKLIKISSIFLKIINLRNRFHKSFYRMIISFYRNRRNDRVCCWTRTTTWTICLENRRRRRSFGWKWRRNCFRICKWGRSRGRWRWIFYCYPGKNHNSIHIIKNLF